MVIFLREKELVKQVKRKEFQNEKELQTFIENNMESLFNIRFLVSEFSTKQHGGRIDSLGLDENNSPVIIEYKWGGKDTIVNQGLFYLDWLVDHEGDFRFIVQEKLKKNIEIDFGSSRVLLIAQSFNKYDKYAINRMAENIELWGYSNYENNIFELKLIASLQAKETTNKKKQISKVNYDKYSIEDHLKNKNEQIKKLFFELQEKIFDLDSEQKIEETPRRFHISYKVNRGFASVKVQQNNIKIYISKNINDPKNITRDVSNIGHHGSGDSEITLKNFDDLDYIVSLIKESYLQSI